jgi:hypothetical protein
MVEMNKQYLSSGGAGGADTDGDRSFLTFYKERGAQIFQAADLGGGDIVLVPQRTQNQHLVAGQDEAAPLAGLNFAQPAAFNTLLKKGYITETNWFVITSIAISPVVFGRAILDCSPATVALPAIAPTAALSSPGLAIDKVVQGIDAAGNTISRAVGTLFGDVWRATASNLSINFLPAGSKCKNEIGDAQSNPSGMTFDSESVANGMVMFGIRNVLDKGIKTNPRSQNGDNTYINVEFNNDSFGQGIVVQDPTGLSAFTVDAAGQYAVIYEITYGGFLADVDGNPINDPKALMLADKAARGMAA